MKREQPEPLDLSWHHLEIGFTSAKARDDARHRFVGDTTSTWEQAHPVLSHPFRVKWSVQGKERAAKFFDKIKAKYHKP